MNIDNCDGCGKLAELHCCGVCHMDDALCDECRKACEKRDRIWHDSIMESVRRERERNDAVLIRPEGKSVKIDGFDV